MSHQTWGDRHRILLLKAPSILTEFRGDFSGESVNFDLNFLFLGKVAVPPLSVGEVALVAWINGLRYGRDSEATGQKD